MAALRLVFGIARLCRRAACSAVTYVASSVKGVRPRLPHRCAHALLAAADAAMALIFVAQGDVAHACCAAVACLAYLLLASAMADHRE